MSKLVKTDGWPVVLPNDNGIRPAGPPDECFYCQNKVGQAHGPRCVVVEKKVKYEVRLAQGNTKVGTFERPDPHFWSPEDCESHKNLSSWCKSNALDHIDWCIDNPQLLFEAFKADSDSDCACGWLTFVFDSVVDEGPLVELRD